MEWATSIIVPVSPGTVLRVCDCVDRMSRAEHCPACCCGDLTRRRRRPMKPGAAVGHLI